MEQSQALRIAWEFVEHTGHSIFLTGKAGTGKTTFLRTVVERTRKRCVVVAPTGVAAINAGGVTIHSFFQLPFSPYIPGAQTRSKFDFGREKRKIIASTDLLIIDEISMVRSDLLDAVDNVLRRFRNHRLPFGGMQLLMIGDLAQLTPVVTAEEERMLTAYYDTPYFFGSKALAQVPYVTIQLTHVFRQQDPIFIDVLNHIREAKPTTDDLATLDKRVQTDFVPKPEAGYIRLTTHNLLANNYNESELRKIAKPSYRFKADVCGTFPETSYPTAETLELKEGAQVMFVKNDSSGEHLYYNGRIGRVTHINQQGIQVVCQGETTPIDVEPLEWENTRYTLNPETREIMTEVQGTFRQYPLRLAWAITIHKSQGLTFQRAIIDANQSFAPGQVYVALSRCRSLDGLVLTAPLNPQAIICDHRVNDYMGHQEEEARHSISQLSTLKDEYGRKLLLELFDFSAIFAAQEAVVRLFADFFVRSQSRLYQLHKEALETLKGKVLEVANKWGAHISGMNLADLYEETFLQRVTASATYFEQQLEEILAQPVRLTAEVKTENKQANKLLAQRLPELRQQWLAKRYLLAKIAQEGFSVSTYLHEKNNATLNALDEEDVRVPRKRTSKKKVKEPKPIKPKTWEASFNLFQDGLSPEQIAKERNLTLRTVCGHLCRYVATGDIPLDRLVPEVHQSFLRTAIEVAGPSPALSLIKNMCPEAITWEEIRYALAAHTGETPQEG